MITEYRTFLGGTEENHNTLQHPIPILIWTRDFPNTRVLRHSLTSFYSATQYSTPYFSPFTYWYIKYICVLTTLIHVSPILQDTIGLKTVITAEVSDVCTEEDVNVDWALHTVSCPRRIADVRMSFVQHFWSQTAALIGQCRYRTRRRVVTPRSTLFQVAT
jgi:hypothetical protein